MARMKRDLSPSIDERQSVGAGGGCVFRVQVSWVDFKGFVNEGRGLEERSLPGIYSDGQIGMQDHLAPTHSPTVSRNLSDLALPHDDSGFGLTSARR